ncbi:MAG: NAD(P)-binding protein, partial [Bacteroidales bacterium]|nr:NAD(P)-binding protein [Bacteroidales bacterium]
MRFIIIGAGLGGLECGYLLSKQGHEVCVLEQGNQIGGCLQTFERHGQRFDTGFHYVGGLGEGEILHQLFSEFNLLNLPWQQLDTECFDEIFLNGEHFVFANGYENFAEKLAESFPAERPALLKYVSLLKSSQEGLADLGNMASSSVTGELLATSAFQYLNDLFP